MKRKWLRTVLSLSLAAVLMVGVTACGDSGSSSSSSDSSSDSSSSDSSSQSEEETSSGTEASGDAIKATLPDGWILKAGKDIETTGYLDDADYIIKAADVDTSAPTLQVALANQSADDIDTWKEWVDGGSFGDANDPFDVNGVTWYTASEGGVALIDGKVCLVYNLNGASFTDSEVQSILGSIAWK